MLLKKDICRLENLESRTGASQPIYLLPREKRRALLRDYIRRYMQELPPEKKRDLLTLVDMEKSSPGKVIAAPTSREGKKNLEGAILHFIACIAEPEFLEEMKA